MHSDILRFIRERQGHAKDQSWSFVRFSPYLVHLFITDNTCTQHVVWMRAVVTSCAAVHVIDVPVASQSLVSRYHSARSKSMLSESTGTQLYCPPQRAQGPQEVCHVCRLTSLEVWTTITTIIILGGVGTGLSPDQKVRRGPSMSRFMPPSQKQDESRGISSVARLSNQHRTKRNAALILAGPACRMETSAMLCVSARLSSTTSHMAVYSEGEVQYAPCSRSIDREQPTVGSPSQLSNVQTCQSRRIKEVVTKKTLFHGRTQL